MGVSASSPRLLPFIILLGAVFALGSLGIDTVLPALSKISIDLHLTDPNMAQWLITAFVLGMGLGNLMGGPISDAHGRKLVIAGGIVLYGAGSTVAYFSSHLEMILLARVVQGIGASFATVAATALVRDVHAGPAMAKVMSYSMIVFAMMPAVAPFIGQSIANLAGWRFIFAVFAAFALALAIYVAMSVKETIGQRTPLSLSSLKQSASDVLKIQIVRRVIIAQTLNFGILFSLISTIQPIFDLAFHRAASFPGYFAIMALAIAAAGITNGKIVEKVEPLKLARIALAGQAVAALLALTGVHFAAPGSDVAFGIFMAWGCASFFANGFSIGNLSSVALEPAGAHAGMASTLIASIPLIGAVALAAPISVLFDGTPMLMLGAVAIFGAAAVATVTLLSEPDGTGNPASA